MDALAATVYTEFRTVCQTEDGPLAAQIFSELCAQNAIRISSFVELRLAAESTRVPVYKIEARFLHGQTPSHTGWDSPAQQFSESVQMVGAFCDGYLACIHASRPPHGA